MIPLVSEYSNVLHPNYCKLLINHFESGVKVSRTTGMLFDEVNMHYDSTTKEIQEDLISYTDNYVNQYKKDWNINFFPNHYGYEALRIKKYSKGGEFPWHADVGDHSSARRFLICMLYLNDDFEGGQTEFRFNHKNYTVTPEVGKMVIFPPLWTHEHRGMPVTSGNKYIINIYRHYL